MSEHNNTETTNATECATSNWEKTCTACTLATEVLGDVLNTCVKICVEKVDGLINGQAGTSPNNELNDAVASISSI